MWWAADDTRSKNFLIECVLALNRNKEIIAATSPFYFRTNKNVKKNIYSYSLLGARNARLNAWYKNFRVCHGIFYSLIRQEVVKSCSTFKENKFFAMDWALIFELLTKGSIQTTDKGRASFGLDGISSKPDFIKKFKISKIDYLFPYWRYSCSTFKYLAIFSTSEKLELFRHLLLLNILSLWLLIKQNAKNLINSLF